MELANFFQRVPEVEWKLAEFITSTLAPLFWFSIFLCYIRLLSIYCSLLSPSSPSRTSLAIKIPVTAWKTCWPPCRGGSPVPRCLEAVCLLRTWHQGGRWWVDLSAATKMTPVAMAPWGNRPPRGQAPWGQPRHWQQDKVKHSVFTKIKLLSGE